MKTPLLVIAACLTIGFGHAQTVHHIEAGGGPNGPTPYYSPQFVTVEIGDTVRWTNSGGTHNVDGTIDTFPNNPEGFGSGNPSNDLWVFDHVFTMSGTYQFECSAFDHNQTQFGSVTVNSPASVQNSSTPVWNIFPNPANDYVEITTADRLTSATLFTVGMKRVADLSFNEGQTGYRVSLQEYPAGSYILQCNFDGELTSKKMILQ